MSRARTAALAAVGLAALSRRLRAPGVVDARDLTGRRAVVTGAGSGIGRALADLLVQRGAEVHLADRDAAAVQAVAEQLRARGARVHVAVADVTDAEAVAGLAADAFAGGPVDLLFNNAGIGHAGAVVDTPLEDWRRLVDVNLMGVVHGLHAFLPGLLAQGRPAHVVNTASLAGLVPSPGLVPYSTTKAAVVGLSEALDAELAGTGVRVTALCPGIIDTAIVRTATMRGEWAQRQAHTASVYARRGTSPDVVARAALDAVTHGRAVAPTPRYQVVPAWLLKRLLPDLGRAVSAALVRGVSTAR